MNRTIGTSIFIVCSFILAKPARGITVSGPITASAVTVSGDATVSSMTVSTITISKLLDIKDKANINGFILQTIYTSTTTNSTTTSTTLTSIPGMSATIALTNPNNYVRISLSGMLETSSYIAAAKVSIKRDSTDLGQGGLSAAYGSHGVVCTGITIIDSPGDTNSHTYAGTFKIAVSTQTASFTVKPLGYLLLQEIAR